MFTDQLEACLLTCGESVPITERISVDEINKQIHIILANHPEMFWYQGKWKLKKEKFEFSIIPIFELPTKNLTQARAEIARLAKEMAGEKGDAWECAENVFSNLAKWASYGPGTDNGQTVYDAFIARSAYCKGLSKAYQYSMSFTEIPCRLAEGNFLGRGRHVWNEINLEGVWYQVDVSTAFPEIRDMIGIEKPIFGWLKPDIDKIYRRVEK